MDNLFTYGTLIYEDEDPNFGIELDKYLEETKEGVVEGDLYVVEGFPFLDPEGKGEVKGKLLVLSNIETVLKKYDRIEGANNTDPFFNREIVDVKLKDGSVEKAYCYVGGESLIKCFGTPEYKVEECNWIKIKSRWE